MSTTPEQDNAVPQEPPTPDGTVWSPSHQMGLDPLHTSVSSEPVSTPGFWRLFTTAIMLRYGPITLVPIFRKLFSRTASYSSLIENRVSEITKRFTSPDTTHPALPERDQYVHDAVKSHMKDSFKKGRVEANAATYDYVLREKTKEHITKQFDMKSARIADAASGTISLGITTAYAHSIWGDIKRVFAETVAYEFDKNPSQVTMRDFFHSDNKLVKTTLSNFVRFNAIRYASDLVFFAPFMLRAAFKQLRDIPINGTYLGLLTKGAFLTKDIISKRRTTFEGLVTFIDHKLNPINGLGDTIEASELVDIYQKYAHSQDPDLAFKGKASLPMWSQSRQVFERMAELMNNTYTPNATANFTLPKYMFLLGHGMINPTRVLESMILVEEANNNGMRVVKEIHAALKNGATLADCLKKYPVTLPAMPVATAAAMPVAGPTNHQPIPVSPQIVASIPEPKGSWGEQMKTGTAEPSLQIR